MLQDRAGEMIPEVEGLDLGGPRGKGSLSVSKGPKPPIQLLQLLKNSPRERKGAHFRYILGPPGSHPGDGITGARRGRSLPVHPGFSSHPAGGTPCHRHGRVNNHTSGDAQSVSRAIVGQNKHQHQHWLSEVATTPRRRYE